MKKLLDIEGKLKVVIGSFSDNILISKLMSNTLSLSQNESLVFLFSLWHNTDWYLVAISAQKDFFTDWPGFKW